MVLFRPMFAIERSGVLGAPQGEHTSIGALYGRRFSVARVRGLCAATDPRCAERLGPNHNMLHQSTLDTPIKGRRYLQIALNFPCTAMVSLPAASGEMMFVSPAGDEADIDCIVAIESFSRRQESLKSIQLPRC